MDIDNKICWEDSNIFNSETDSKLTLSSVFTISGFLCHSVFKLRAQMDRIRNVAC